MIYPDHLEGEILKYCQAANIPIVNGVVPGAYMPQVQKFLEVKMKQDRLKTRKMEEFNKFSINPMLQMMVKNTVESPIEEYMYNAFIENGLNTHCRPQYEIGTKRVDFAFPIAKLVVECDGKQYHHSDGEQIERDQKRDMYLAKKGWRVLHFEGLAIRRNINLCIDQVKAQLQPFLKLQGA